MKLIQLSYRKIIDAQSASVWEQYVFEDTYNEFLMQAQLYNKEKKYQTFSQLLAAVPYAEKLHFLVSTAVTGYIAQLNNKIPDIKNTLGKTFLPFHLYRLEIIESNIQNKKEHRIAICFYSESIQWLDTIGDNLLLSLNTESSNNRRNTDAIIPTELLKLQPFISIHSLQFCNYGTNVFGKNILS